MKHKDFPFDEVSTAAEKLAKEGWRVYQKFTCDKCGSRQTMKIPNVFYKKGCCEECNHETDIVKRGCNYVLIGMRWL